MAANSVFIVGKLPSLNEYIDACRENRYVAANMKARVERDIVLQLGKLRPVSKPVHVRFEWHEKTKRRDKDNVAFAKKFVFDALQKAGKIPNDNNRYIDSFDDSFVYGKDQGVLIELIEV